MCACLPALCYWRLQRVWVHQRTAQYKSYLLLLFLLLMSAASNWGHPAQYKYNIYTDGTRMCACLPALCYWLWIAWCMHVSCIDSDVHSCFELWSALRKLSQSNWIRRYIRITYYYYHYMNAQWIIVHQQLWALLSRTSCTSAALGTSV